MLGLDNMLIEYNCRLFPVKTRSVGQILLKPYVHSENTGFSLVCCLRTVCQCLLALHLGVTGRLCFEIVAIPGHRLKM